MNIIGIHDGHNASVALFQNGKITYAVSEERILRKKNAGGFPKKALERLINDTLLTPDKINAVFFSGLKTPRPQWYEKEKILERYKEQLNSSTRNTNIYNKLKNIIYKSFIEGGDKSLEELNKNRIENMLNLGFSIRQLGFLDHHECHAAAAYYSLGNYEDEILCLTNDGGGDGLCATVNIGKEGQIKRISSTNQIHSIANLYARTTFLLGMMPLEHEYKLMGMAPYSDLKKASNLAKNIVSRFELQEDGSLSWKKKDHLEPTAWWGPYLKELFYLVRFDTIAAAIQLALEELAIKWIKNCIKKTNIHQLALSGGTFMNVKLNKLILELPEVESIFVMPSCSDESNSIGAAFLGAVRKGFDGSRILPLKDLYLGPKYSGNDIDVALDKFLKKDNFFVTKPECIEDEIASLLAKGHIVANYSAREEFGARALGNRSILSDPSRLENITELNKMIKQRDFWMPFAGIMTAQQAKRNIINPKNHFAPYMIIAFDTNKHISEFRAAIHPYDMTIRPQILLEEWNPRLYKILKLFELQTGKSGGLLNTSFNLHGFPIVSSPYDALDVFNKSGLLFLAIGPYLVSKNSVSKK